VRRALVAVVAALGVLAPAVPASAATWTGEDAVRDVSVYRFSPRPAPCGTLTGLDGSRDRRRDLTGVAVDHGPELLTVTLSLRSVVRNDRSTSYAVHLRVPRHRYALEVVPARLRGFPDVTIGGEDRPGRPSGPCGVSVSVTQSGYCDGLESTTRPAARSVEVRIPRDCIGDPAWVRVGASVQGFGPTRDGQTFTGFSDRWVRPGGPQRATFVPPYGPRVLPG
jgi:hypothetical protein